MMTSFDDKNQNALRQGTHVIGFSDFVDLWVIKIKKSTILCARSTTRSSEEITKRELERAKGLSIL